MKKTIKTLLCLLTWATGVLAKPILKSPADNTSLRGPIVTPSFQNPIHPTDLSTSANPQFTIKSSGRYYVTNHLNRNHSTAAGTILLVKASNVNLDLNSKTIAPSVSGSMTTGTAIAVAQGLSNIQVSNGFIHGQDGSTSNGTGVQKLDYGIDLNETTLSSGSGTSYQIKLQDLQITRCITVGIFGSTINDLTIERCTCNDGKGTTDLTAGAQLDTINNLKINNCTFSGNANSSSGAITVYGLSLTSCTDGVIENVICAKNNASSTSSCIGAYLSSCTNMIMKNVSATTNSAAGTTCYGINLTGSTNNQLINCITNGNTTSANDSSVIGIYLQSSSHNCRLENCLANGNSNSSTGGTGGTAYGSYMQSSNALCVTNCQFNGNTSTATGATIGLILNTITGSTFRNCQTCSSSSTGSGASAHAYGTYLDSNCNNNSFVKCLANSNSAGSTSAVRSVGFYSSANTNNNFDQCIANRNQATTTANVAAIAAGFMFAGAETRSQILNCETAHNVVGNQTSSGTSARAYGIYFDGSSATVNCSVKNCNLNYNTPGTTGGGRAFGFYDNSTTSTTILIGNIAIGQGQCLGSTLEDDLQWNGNSEPSSNQNFFFKHAGTGDDPRQMISEVPHQNFGSISTAVVKWQNISVF